MFPITEKFAWAVGRIKTILAARKIFAIFVMLAVIMPVAAPIPAWAYDLKLPRVQDSGFRLTADAPTLPDVVKNLSGNLFGGFGLFATAKDGDRKPAKKEFSIETLEKRVAGIDTEADEKQTVAVGQTISLSAVPVDKDENPVNGLAARWECADSEVVRLIDNSQAVALKAGQAKLTVTAGKIKREIDIVVTDQPRANQDLGDAATNQFAPPPDEPVMLESEAVNLVTPENNLGNPPGQTEMPSPSTPAATRTRERYGSSNYSFGVPVASLPGRGMDAGIGMTYNSRVWNKSDFGGTLVFDYNVDGNWLAPGFEMGFGEIEGYSTSSGYGYLLTGPDGTRTQLIHKQASGGCVTYESMDGTFVQTKVCGVYAQGSMLVKYADGTQVTYGAITQTGKRFPVTIQDRNGNYINITYLQNDSVGKISTIRDTLNRYITFHYDNTTEKKLVAVSVPGYDGATTPRQTIRFYYEDLTLQTAGRFDSAATVNAPATVKVLKYVYFPGTQTGYKYDYSPYFGMIYKIWQMRGMQASTDSVTETGTITSEGTAAASTHYNYAATPGELDPPLTDVPKYDIRYDDWLGRTTAIPETHFFTEESVTPAGCQISLGTCTGTRTTIVTAPDGTKSLSFSNIRPTGDWENGLLTETKVGTQTGMEPMFEWSRTKLYWQQGDNQPTGRDNPRLAKVEVTNDAFQTRATSFEYDGYNNQTVVRDHDFAAEGTLGAELRRTETTYETGAGWTNNRQIRLPKTITTIVNNIAVSKIQYEYDNYTGSPLANTPGVMQHNGGYSPYSGTYTCNCRWECVSGQEIPGQRQCTDGSTQQFICDQCPIYNPATAYRGNVTKVTAFADATLASDPNAVITTMKYDITGNVIETGASCCKEKSWTYDLANGYAYPVVEEMGDAGQLETSATYDFNTGLVKTATDENSQTTTLTYNPANLRLTRTDSPNGAWATTEYNDTTFPYHVKSTASLDATRSVSSWSFSNGRGQGFRSRSQTANGYLSSDAEFDLMGRPVRSFNPYTVAALNDSRSGDIKFSEIVSRDGLGRVLQTRLPDLTTVSASYSGLVATATDQAGKQRRQIADSLGRTARVDEPNASGILGDVNAPVQPTNYEYDGNDNLTKVTQSDGTVTQERLFKYDSLSRLSHERQVEATATLDSNGVKVGAGGLWTGVYKYNNESLLAEGTDARGVKTTFGYDGLNRIQSVAYTGETGYQTPNVTYTYDEAETGFHNLGRLTKVQTAANATYGTPETIQNYDYDKVGQVTKHIQSIGNQTYNLEYGYNLAGQLTSEKYPSGKIVTMAVDNFGRLATVADTQRTYLTGTTFNNQGLLSQFNLGNFTKETFSYNDRFQMISQSLMRNTEVLTKYDYSYGQTDLNSGAIDATKNNGQLGKIEGWIGATKQWSQRFGYDELGRLKQAREYKQGDNGQLTYKQVFDFDRFGNLYRKTASNPTSGQQNPLPYTPIEDAEISKATNRIATGTSYDEAGQVITDDKYRSMGFGYDANGRTVKATKTGVPDAWTVYDGLGNRVATKANDVWEFIVYDAFGKLVAEYGLPRASTGSVKFIQQDWQGSVRNVTNKGAFVVYRTDHQAFGEEIGAGIGLRTAQQGFGFISGQRQGYGLTEKDESSGLNHTWFRKIENRAGRMTSPDPYTGSMSVGSPQSFNRYSYAGSDPINFVDPTGLYTACAHQAMTKFLGNLAGIGSHQAQQIANYAGGAVGGADSHTYKATNLFNWIFGSSTDIHFPTEEQLATGISRYQGFVSQGERGGAGSWRGYQAAGFVLHAIQDSLGAHSGINPRSWLGHVPQTVGSYIPNGMGGYVSTDPDTVIGDAKFEAAATRTYQVLKNDPKATLTPAQINDLIKAILTACGKNFKVRRPQAAVSGGGDGGSGDGGPGPTYGGGYGWNNNWFSEWFFHWASQQRWEETDVIVHGV